VFFLFVRRRSKVMWSPYGKAKWAALAVVLLILAGCAAPAPEPTTTTTREEVDPATRHHALAQQYAKNGDYVQAELQYQKGLAMDPVNIPMMRGLADVYMKLAARTKESLKARGASPDTSQAIKSYYDKAVRVYDEALGLEPDNTEIREGRAYTLTAAQRFDEAIAESQGVIALKPDDASVHINLGYTYQKKGDVDGAVAAYTRAVELDPDDRDTVLRIARMLYDNDREPESRFWFARAYELDPSDVAMGKFLGALYIRAKDFESSVPIYESLVNEDPEDWRSWLNYGVALQKTDNLDEALLAYQEVMRLNPEKVEVYFEAADIYVEMQRFDEAIEIVNQGLDRNPDMANGYVSKGRALEKLGSFLGEQKRFDDGIAKYEEAKATFQKGLALNDPRLNEYFRKQIPRQDQLIDRMVAKKDAEAYGYD
jgi:tetratricopeptide (TPR) repeat protein